MDTGTAGTGTDFHTGTGHFGKLGAISYRYLRYRCGRLYRSCYQYRYDIDTDT